MMNESLLTVFPIVSLKLLHLYHTFTEQLKLGPAELTSKQHFLVSFDAHHHYHTASRENQKPHHTLSGNWAGTSSRTFLSVQHLKDTRLNL